MGMHKPHAPCGHNWRATSIARNARFLWPTVFVDCSCRDCNATWVERYEFDFSVPLGGETFEQATKPVLDRVAPNLEN